MDTIFETQPSSVKLVSWNTISDSFSKIFTGLFGRTIRVLTHCDSFENYWWIELCNDKFSVEEQHKLLCTFGADAQDIEENMIQPEKGIPYEPEIRTLSKRFTEKIMANFMDYSPDHFFIGGTDGIWMVRKNS